MTVHRDAVVKKLANITFDNQDGIISSFNVLVNFLPVTFWNNFAERMMEAVPPEKHDELKAGLVRCANECGYHTGHGIINSEEFKAVVEPMITEGAKDVLRGAFAVFTAWGWAKSGIAQIKEGERMVIRAVDYYEADGQPGEKRAFMIQGVSAAFFDLAYSAPYPDGLGKYQCEQVAGIECGDAFGEFVVTEKK
ncbi:MAG: hypothetical protein HQK55_15220 [Deltaproteobacteria bacterium]|nr:hypothetical protein [Deltaproteobacteria bacterium]